MISEAALFAIGLVTGGISSAIIVQRVNARAFDEYDDDLIERDAKILNLNAECERLAGIVGTKRRILFCFSSALLGSIDR